MTQYLLSTTASTYVRWKAPRSGVCRIQCFCRITWPTNLVLDVKTSVIGAGPQYPSGFSSLQFTANGISSPFTVAANMEVWVLVNTIGTSAEIELTPSFE